MLYFSTFCLMTVGLVWFVLSQMWIDVFSIDGFYMESNNHKMPIYQIKCSKKNIVTESYRERKPQLYDTTKGTLRQFTLYGCQRLVVAIKVDGTPIKEFKNWIKLTKHHQLRIEEFQEKKYVERKNVLQSRLQEMWQILMGWVW